MAEDKGAEAPKKDLKKFAALGFAGLNIAVLCLGAFLVYSSTLGKEQPSVTNSELNREIDSFLEELRKDPVMFTMETFNTNLDGVPRRMIRTAVTLEMLDDEGFEEVVVLGAEARDAVLKILNAKQFDDVESVQGKLLLKNQIITQVNGFLKHGVVKNVYFSDFVVQ